MPSCKADFTGTRDELIVEVPEQQADLAAQILKEEMEHVVQFAVPLTVEVKKGKAGMMQKVKILPFSQEQLPAAAALAQRCFPDPWSLALFEGCLFTAKYHPLCCNGR